MITGFTLDAASAGQLSEGDVAVGFRNGATLTTQDGPRPIALPLTRGVKPFGATAGGQHVRMLERNLTDTQPAAVRGGDLPAGADRPRDQRRPQEGRDRDRLRAARDPDPGGAPGALDHRRARHVLAPGQGDRRGAASRATCRCRATTSSRSSRAAFNTMASELEQRIEELDGERRRVQEAVGRFGQALESTHDVSALLGIVIESAMEAVGARGGRVVIVDEQTNSLVEHRRLGTAEDAPRRRAAGRGS